MFSSNVYSAVFANKNGEVYDCPDHPPVFRSGRRLISLSDEQMIPLPPGGFIFSMPARNAVYLDGEKKFKKLKVGREDVLAASAFVPSGYLRTLLPGFILKPNAPRLSLWGYSGLAFANDQFWVPAIRIDDDPRSDPAIHQNDKELEKKIKQMIKRYPDNRLVKQLAYCGTEYRCLCARNFFMERYEAPIPTTPACNAGCLGCLSFQDEKISGFKASQNRLSFSPSPEEIAQVISHHLKKVKNGVASFGQGCEGEPILRAFDLSSAISLVRKETKKGRINLNTNGSLPKNAQMMIDAGLDSIRISLNSVSEKYYNPYYRPTNYNFKDVLKTIDISLEAGINVALNLFFFPGFTDSDEEVSGLWKFLKKYPVNQIQTRNLNIDPDFYLDTIKFPDQNAIGLEQLIASLRSDFPKIKLGYYNLAK